MAATFDLGIDLGTTNCTIGRLDADGRARVFGPIPSVGAWRNGNVEFGDEGRQVLLDRNQEVFPIRDLKLRLGYEDVQAGMVRLSAVDLTSKLLRYLKGKVLDEESVVRLAVIGTPVRMPRKHRVELRNAALKAGFESVRLVYEPTAALIGQLDSEEVEERSLTLVVDWGGGTLDIAVVRVEDGLFRELSVGGDIRTLGGTQIDEEITTRLLKSHREADAKVRQNRGMFDRLKEEIEREKIAILGSLEGSNAEPPLIIPAWLDEILELQPKMVFDVLDTFTQRAREQIQATLHAAHLREEDITHILFAGGVCKADCVRNGLLEPFPQARLIEGRDPQLLTGYGCSRLTGTKFSVELAADFAVRQCDNSLCVLLPKGQPLELNCFRKATFLVTDISAPEALFDFGVCHFDDGVVMLEAAGDTFQSMKQLWIRAGRPQTRGGKGVADQIILHTGIEDTLTIAINLRSCNSEAEEQSSVSGVPLAIRLNRDLRIR